MDKKKLTDIAKDKGFISSIYNYCDRWCERCPQTSKCLLYAINEEDFSDPETRDIHNKAFWNRLSGILADTLDLINEKAAAEGIDLDSLDLDKLEEKDLSVIRVADNHDISHAAMAYSQMTEDWFNEAGVFSVKDEKDALSDLLVAGNKYNLQDEDLEDALKVIRWYQHQIYAKLIRAISGRIEEDAEISEEADKYARDSDGSAKVALIGIDRSIAAWIIIDNRIPTFERDDVKAIMTHLDKLMKKIENDFPDARAFLRPGFDRIDLNS